LSGRSQQEVVKGGGSRTYLSLTEKGGNQAMKAGEGRKKVREKTLLEQI